jgi:hypothetical protein
LQVYIPSRTAIVSLFPSDCICDCLLTRLIGACAREHFVRSPKDS